MMLSRRDAIVGLTWMGLEGFSSQACLVSRRPLSFTLYGMRDVPLKEALPALAKLGYTGIEVAAMPGWVTDPLRCGPDSRKEIRDQLKDHGLKLVSVMESIPYSPDAKTLAAHQEKLKRAIQLGHDLDPDQTPLLETILGGKPGELSKHQGGLMEMLQSWARILETNMGRVALKAHRFQMVSTHEDLADLMMRVPSASLVCTFDPSHQPEPQADCRPSLARLAKRLAFLHIKDIDWKQSPAKDASFVLPGQGKLNWKGFLSSLESLSREIPICVEVSRQVWDRPGYNPLDAARICMDFWKKNAG